MSGDLGWRLYLSQAWPAAPDQRNNRRLQCVPTKGLKSLLPNNEAYCARDIYNVIVYRHQSVTGLY